MVLQWRRILLTVSSHKSFSPNSAPWTPMHTTYLWGHLQGEKNGVSCVLNRAPGLLLFIAGYQLHPHKKKKKAWEWRWVLSPCVSLQFSASLQDQGTYFCIKPYLPLGTRFFGKPFPNLGYWESKQLLISPTATEQTPGKTIIPTSSGR